ncbi:MULTISPECIES: MORN repeat-containing protein [Bacillaceae]|uniref:MORN repeat protein n=1 Tax=Evansella alkalicola TaxID=745819 RepID=A0ABS6JX84_9BACI|nr:MULTISPECIES: hypothetical protein [Bacillaceae]MBU9723200.1 hypothetical protein [Bacillus alkalicola]
MINIFIILTVLSIIALFISLIKPAFIIRWGPVEKRGRLRALLYFGAPILPLLFLIYGAFISWIMMLQMLGMLVGAIVLIVILAALFLAPAFFILGMVKPKLSLWWQKSTPTRKRVSLLYGGAFAVSLTAIIVIGLVGDDFDIDAIGGSFESDEGIIYGVYSGDRNDSGDKHGVGTLTNNSGFFTGHWDNDIKSGPGEESMNLGVFLQSHFEGYWENNERSGYGVETIKFLWMTVTYEGDYVDGLRHGHGKLVDRKGNIYEGEWAYDQPNGYGEAILSNGESYVGEWKDWERHGEGTLLKDGEIIHQGTFIEDRFQD